MKSISKIKVFISCPGEIKDELNSISIILNETNKVSGKHHDYIIESINWNIDTYTQVGVDPQDVINKQIDNVYDLLIGILWKKLGSKTTRDKSGTVEEINRAINNKKEILIYFRTSPPDNLNEINLDDLKDINDFKKDLSNRGVLYKEYNHISAFESLLRIHLPTLIGDKLLNKKISELDSRDLAIVDKYKDISDAIKKIEEKKEDDSLDIFQFIEQVTSNLGIVTTSLESLTIIITNLSVKLTERTSNLTKYMHITDNKLRFEKTKIVVNILADELDEYCVRINSELEVFAEYFPTIGPGYAKIISLAPPENAEDIRFLKENAVYFRNSIFGAVQNSVKVLEMFSAWPPVNAKFNKSKRLTELTFKNITKEMLEGLMLLDEALSK